MEKIEAHLDDKRKGTLRLYVNDDKAGEMVISENDETITVYHTEVSDAFSGKGYAHMLLDALVNRARTTGRTINPLCPYVFAEFTRQPEQFADVWKKRA